MYFVEWKQKFMSLFSKIDCVYYVTYTMVVLSYCV